MNVGNVQASMFFRARNKLAKNEVLGGYIRLLAVNSLEASVGLLVDLRVQ